ncbi:MAG: class I SAM-dependent methyltransferase [Chlorobiales bacterium]|nr:class I SAM-dependent methyltransferase [Chlorobiales bacterium]
MILDVTGLGAFAEEKKATLSALDIACGAGRHAVELAEQGFSVTANDLSPFLLNETASLAETHHVDVRLSQCDMREIGFKEEFDLVVQLFTSFGYFQDHEDEQRVITNVYRALKTGGWYVLDFFNSNHVRKSLNPFSVREIEGMSVVEERRIQCGRVEKVIALNENGRVSEFKESVRLYSYEELELMVAEAGFQIYKVLGNYDADRFDPLTSPRVIIIARK